jgi:cellobiose phosphorylase
VRGKLDSYQCRHGLGYTIISSRKNDVACEITYFVPLGEDLEIWRLKITNLSKKPKKLALFSYVEFCLWDAVGDAANFQRTWNIGRAHAEKNTIYHTTLYGSWLDIFAYFHCSAPVSSFDCQRKAFLGNHGYNNLDNPEAVQKGCGSNSVAIGWAPIGSHCINVDLKAGQTETILFVLGVAKDRKISAQKIKQFSSVAVVETALKRLNKFWSEKLSNFHAVTPDPDMNLMLNTWNQYQCITTFNWSRYASYYEAGIGRGMGFRDSNQDTLGFVHMLPEKARRRILDLAAIQFENGSTYHQYSPITGQGDLWGYSDDQLWLIYATVHYIKETGDFKILNEKAPFAVMSASQKTMFGHHNYLPPDLQVSVAASGARGGVKGKSATLYEHLCRAIEYTAKNLGPQGLPKAGFADWNDCLNMLGTKQAAESVLVGMMLVGAADLMAELAGKIKDAKKGNPLGKKSSRQILADQKRFLQVAEKMRKTVNCVAWDGSWYKRAFDDKSRPVGSEVCKEGKIYLETQAWAVMSGTAAGCADSRGVGKMQREAADGTRGKMGMDAVHKYLATKYGIILQQPALRHFHPELGEISTYPPGLKENAAIFCHPNPWAVVAETMLGRGERAYEYYRAILPVAQNDIAETRKTEPYVYCQMVAGPDHPDFGEGKNSWLTGSASWNFVAAAEYILGIRPDYDGLRIDPCLPPGWKGFEATRVWRGATYNIKVHNPEHVSRGVKSLRVDGDNLEGNLIPAFKDGRKHKVEVEMGPK